MKRLKQKALESVLVGSCRQRSLMHQDYDQFLLTYLTFIHFYKALIVLFSKTAHTMLKRRNNGVPLGALEA